MNSDKKPLKSNTVFFTALITLLITLAFLLISNELPLPNYAYAHSLPVTETPAPNSIIKKGEPSPSKIIIDFSERPDPNVSIMQVHNSKNQRVDSNDFTIVGDDGREATTTLNTRKLTDGVYTVSWMTLSADDGHIARGSYVFGIGSVSPNSATGAPASIINGKQTQVQEITSTLDGIIQWPLLISQVTIVGGIFSHLFLWEKFASRIGRSSISEDNTTDRANLRWLRTFSIILVAAAIVIIATGSLLLFLQITELSPNNTFNHATIFKLLLMGPSGMEWLIRSITSFIIIVASASYYHLLKKRINKMTISSASGGQQQYKLKKVEGISKKSTSNQTTITSSLLYVSLIAGAVCIFSNSMTSHNAGVKFLPSLAISLDWLHFMAVSIWVGGLFYISTVLLNAIKANVTTSKITAAATSTISTTSKIPKTIANKKRGTITPPMTYYLALLLPRFSLIATISLGVIGVSGLYMAWIQLHSINALFDTSYGITLIIKLSAILPLVLLGAYHQLILHRNVVLAASIGREEKEKEASSTYASDNRIKIEQSLNNTDDNNNSSKKEEKIGDIFSKFSKTIKVESLLAIGVLLAASLLTITSPPTMNISSMSMMYSNTNSHSSMSDMSTIMPMKNSTYVNEVKIMNVNTKIEINPLYVGFNTFKISFTDSKGKPVPNISGVELTFTNNRADIGPITANLEKTGPGVYFNTGAYISQPGDWEIAMAAQRTGEFDLNYQFTSKVNNAPPQQPPPISHTVSNVTSGTTASLPTFDSFAWLAIGLAILVVFGSAYYYGRSKQELRKTIEMLEA